MSVLVETEVALNPFNYAIKVDLKRTAGVEYILSSSTIRFS